MGLRQFVQRMQQRRAMGAGSKAELRTSAAMPPKRSPLMAQAIQTLKVMTAAGAVNGSFLMNAYKLVKEFRKSNQQRSGEVKEQFQRWQGHESKGL